MVYFLKKFLGLQTIILLASAGQDVKKTEEKRLNINVKAFNNQLLKEKMDMVCE